MGKSMYPESFIKRVRAERAKGKMTIDEIANKFSIGSATVKRWTKGVEVEGDQASELEVKHEQEQEPRRIGRRPTFGQNDMVMLDKIGEKGYGEAMTFAKWLNAVATRRPNVTISTAFAFFKVWLAQREGIKAAAEGEVTVDSDSGPEVEGGATESEGGRADEANPPSVVELSDNDNDVLLSDGAVVAVEDYEVCATT